MAKKKTASNSTKKTSRNTKRRLLIFVPCVLFICAALSLFFIRVSYENTVRYDVDFETTYKDEPSIELGTEKTSQKGQKGVETVRFEYTQSLFSKIFNLNHVKIKKIGSNTINTKPKKEIILTGIRKWQYMMCSDGSYMHYTDKQFKDKDTGYTSKSADNCKKNNHGVKIGLADSASGANNSVKPKNVPNGCSMKSIPYRTVYKSADWLNVGETSGGYSGVDGFEFTCRDGSRNSRFEPIDGVIYRGTKKSNNYDTSDPSPKATSPDYGAQSKCYADYTRAKAQVTMANAGPTGYEIVEKAYSQCLRDAGF